MSLTTRLLARPYRMDDPPQVSSSVVESQKQELEEKELVLQHRARKVWIFCSATSSLTLRTKVIRHTRTELSVRTYLSLPSASLILRPGKACAMPSIFPRCGLPTSYKPSSIGPERERRKWHCFGVVCGACCLAAHPQQICLSGSRSPMCLVPVTSKHFWVALDGWGPLQLLQHSDRPTRPQ